MSIRKLFIGLGIAAGLLYAKPAKGLDSPPLVLTPIIQEQEAFDYFQPLDISLLPEAETSYLTLKLTPSRTTMYGLPTLGTTQRTTVTGNFSLSPNTTVSTQIYLSKIQPQLSEVEMLRARAGINDSEEFFENLGRSETSLDEMVLGVTQGKSTFEIRQNQSSIEYKGSFDDISLGLHERGSTKTQNVAIGDLKLTRTTTPTSTEQTVDYKGDDYALHLRTGTDTEQITVEKGDASFSYTDAGRGENVILKQGDNSVSFSPNENIFQVATPAGPVLGVVDTPYGTDVGLKGENWGLEHSQDGNLFQYSSGKLLLSFISDEEGIRPHGTAVRADLGALRLGGLSLDMVLNLSFTDSYKPNRTLDIGSPGSNLFFRQKDRQESLTANWSDPNNEGTAVHLDVNNGNIDYWFTYKKRV